MAHSDDSNQSQLVPVPPFDLIVMGASGDLALRKLLPALFHRWMDGQIPDNSSIIGVSRSHMTSDDYRALVKEKFGEFHPEDKPSPDDWDAFINHVHYVGLDMLSPETDWTPLTDLLANCGPKQRVFYLALPPSIYGAVSERLGAAGLVCEGARIVLEKPIGKDLDSAREINEAVARVFPEQQTFRIDHYLGKETVQNLIVLRFMNSLFEPIWSSNTIDHVEISVAETVGVGDRAGYYSGAGALRDMVQNHLLQLLCLVAMEPPLDLAADTVRDEKIKVLRALRPVTKETVRSTTVRGQYGAGAVAGKTTISYLDELGHESSTETFVAIKAMIDNWRWKGVPFYMRTGKRMTSRYSEIIIQFKEVAHAPVEVSAGSLQPTRLVIRLQPDEGMKLLLVTKDPGPGGMRLRYVPLNLSYADQFEARYPDAYERLLMAVVRGDLGLFMRADEVEAAWRWVDGILSSWQADETPTHSYPAGSDGPVQAAILLDRDGREWFGGL